MKRVSGPVGLYLATRAGVWIAAAFALLAFDSLTRVFGAAELPWIVDVGWFVDMWSRWDGSWFVGIARDGYVEPEESAAFFPLYPLAVRGIAELLGEHYVLAGVLVSLAAGAAAVLVLHRLATQVLGLEAAGRTVLYLSLFPMSIFLLAVYSEALYLLLAAATFLLALRGRFVTAGLVAGLALLTRSSAVALLPALALLAWQVREGRVRAFASVALAGLVGALWPLWLWVQHGDPLLSARAQSSEQWNRDLSPLGPLGGIWQGLEAGWASLRQLLEGGEAWSYASDTSPMYVAFNLEQLSYAALFLALAVVVWRRVGPAFGIFVAVSLALPLSAPPPEYPLLSMPRFGLGIFPIFLALAVLGDRARTHRTIVWVSATLLGVTIARWSAGLFVA